jgi:ribosome-binding factor A
MDPRRSERVSETIREELDELLAWEMSDPRIQVSGVAEVLISPDARIAQVRVITEGGPDEQKETLAALNHARAYIKRELSTRVDLFRIPELRFEAAVAAELAPKVSRLLKRVRRGRPRPDAEAPATRNPTDQS